MSLESADHPELTLSLHDIVTGCTYYQSVNDLKLVKVQASTWDVMTLPKVERSRNNRIKL